MGRRVLDRTLNGLLIITAALTAFGCSSAATAVPCQDDPYCLRYGLSADFSILDPHHAESPEAGIVLRQLYDTLLYRDSDTHAFVPGLAREWQVSQDGLVYTFMLREDVIFHDGSQFEAPAVARNIERIYDPSTSSSLARRLLGPLQQYEILDQFTIRFYLSTPFSAFLDAWAQPFLGIASPAALDTYDVWRYQFHQSGTGPFILAEYLPGERIVLRRYEQYSVRPAVYAQLAGDEINRVEFVIQQEEDGSASPLLDGSLDIIDDLSPLAALSLAGNSRVQILPTEIAGQTVQFIFNTNRAPLNSREVRLALLLATNRIALNDQVFYGYSPVAWAPLSESTGYAHTGYVNQFTFDLDQARELLSSAGFQDSDGNGILDRDGNSLELRIVVPPWGQLPDVAAVLKEQWRAVGVNLLIEPVPGKARLDSLIQSGEFDLLPIDNHGIDPALLNRIFHDNTAYLASQAPHQALSELLARASQEPDQSQRRRLYYEIQALLMNEILILPVRETVRLTAARADIRNLRFDAYGFYPLLFNLAVANS